MNKPFHSPAHKIPLALGFITFLFASAFQQPNRSVSPWLWVLVVAALILLVALVLIRQTRASTPPPAAPVEGTTARSFQAEDDLAIIEGIGPKIAQVLRAAGITTFNQLANMDAEEIQSICASGGIRLVDPRSWPEQARLAAAGDMEGLQALQGRLRAGRTV